MTTAKSATLIIDTEALGLWDDCVLLSVGCCLMPDEWLKTKKDLTFSDMMKESKEFKLSVKDQIRLGRKTYQSTVEWWSKQGDSAKRVLKASPDDILLADLFPHLEEWITSKGYGWKALRLYDRQKFDMSKLQHIREVSLGLGDRHPWDVTDTWDIASVMHHMEGNRYGSVSVFDIQKDPAFIYHNAACDAALDMLRFFNLFSE